MDWRADVSVGEGWLEVAVPAGAVVGVVAVPEVGVDDDAGDVADTDADAGDDGIALPAAAAFAAAARARAAATTGDTGVAAVGGAVAAGHDVARVDEDAVADCADASPAGAWVWAWGGRSNGLTASAEGGAATTSMSQKAMFFPALTVVA